MWAGALGHVPTHLPLRSAARNLFDGCSDNMSRVRSKLLCLPVTDGPLQYFKGALLGTWRDLVSAKMCIQKESWGGPLLDYLGSLRVLDSTHVRGGDKGLLLGILSWGLSGTVFFLVNPEEKCSSLLWRC